MYPAQFFASTDKFFSLISVHHLDVILRPCKAVEGVNGVSIRAAHDRHDINPRSGEIIENDGVGLAVDAPVT